MKQIIVAMDFSYSSLNAANYAADMAASINMNIILIHVIETPTTAFQLPLTEIEFTVLENNIREELEELRQKLLLRTRNEINISKELRYGVIDQELEKLGEETKPFAIVMGIAAGKKEIRFFLGSNTLRLLPDTSYPILIIPEKAAFIQIKSITIASDFAEMDSSQSFDSVKNWLKVFSPRCDIVYVQPAHESSNGFAVQTNILQKYFAEFNPQFHVIDADNAETGVLNFMEEKNPDLLVVLPEKHGHFGFLFHTSISRKLVLRAQLPVLSIILQIAKNNSIINEDQEGKENRKHDCSVCNGACKKRGKENITENTPTENQKP